jgi:hypothetical protein
MPRPPDVSRISDTVEVFDENNMTVRKSSPSNRQLQEQARKRHEKHWLAIKGSAREKQFLKRWSEQKGLSERDRTLISEWIDNPDAVEKRNALFWQAAKRSVLGDVVYEAAMERHRKLNDAEWLVACFTAQGIKQQEIAGMIHAGGRTVDNIVDRLKVKIMQELECDIESVTLPQIACWFFGL